MEGKIRHENLSDIPNTNCNWQYLHRKFSICLVLVHISRLFSRRFICSHFQGLEINICSISFCVLNRTVASTAAQSLPMSLPGGKYPGSPWAYRGDSLAGSAILPHYCLQLFSAHRSTSIHGTHDPSMETREDSPTH